MTPNLPEAVKLALDDIRVEARHESQGHYTLPSSALAFINGAEFALNLMRAALSAAIDQLAAHQAEGWISVEDRLPDVSGIEDGEAVLVANRGGSFCAEWHGTGITGFSSYGYGDQFVQVTHWMPLPAAPPIPSNGGAGEAL